MALKIAILGANSQIAKNITYYLGNDDQYEITLFSRRTHELEVFWKDYGYPLIYSPYSVFPVGKFDVILNCVGITALEVETPLSVIQVTEEFDNMALEALKRNPSTKYIYISSGAVYGDVLPANGYPTYNVKASGMTVGEYYSFSKIATEVKHRAYNRYDIVDLRVFSFFSRYISLESNYLITEILKAIRSRTSLMTNEMDIIRDYIHPHDFACILKKIIHHDQPLNAAFDVYSKSATSKFEILEAFKNTFALSYEIKSKANVSLTGIKKGYYSQSTALGELGYIPQYTALEALLMESKVLLTEDEACMGRSWK